jgi:nanoRNase/pAp phosphatase (c-di-AMP/oligoRNAs hydrolase)
VFLKASKLISLGAKQQEIITNLYRSKSLGLLRLWGRVLARLKQDRGLVYSVVSASDIEKSQAGSSDLNQIIFEMMEQLSFAKIFLFIAEVESQKSQVFIAGLNPLDLADLLNKYNPINLGNNIYRFEVSQPVLETETQILQLITPVI